MEKIVFEGHTYTISYAPETTAVKEKLNKQPLQIYLNLLDGVQKNPKAVYKQVKAFAKEHQDVPEVLNLLTFAHIRNRRVMEAEKLIRKTFDMHPDYLFARINYADQCVRQKKLDKVRELFPTFKLHELCPEKDVFHTSEFRGFFIMMTYYHLARKDRAEALRYFGGAKKVEPNHPSVVFLEKKLFKVSLLKKLRSRFLPAHR